MTELEISFYDFRREVQLSDELLTSHGFRRAPHLDQSDPMTASVVYVGREVSFIFTFDYRDQIIGLEVARCVGGVPAYTWDGGYSSSLFYHLIKHEGLRGRPPTPDQPNPSGTNAGRKVWALVSLLTLPCAARLLADRGDALPR